MKPNAFVSHASADQKRFVAGFARKLRANGVEAWYAPWEMAPGDSLPERIFVQGLAAADTVVVVVSKHSIASRWVREELNVATVRRIAGKCRIIPVMIDECEVPADLEPILWVKIPNLNNYDAEFAQILQAIFGHSDKPPIGDPPAYAQPPPIVLPDLTPTDMLVLKAIGDTKLATGNRIQTAQEIAGVCRPHDIPAEEVHDSFQVLLHRGFLEHPIGTGGMPLMAQLTTHGFEAYGRAYVPAFDELVRQVALCVVNHRMDSVALIAGRLGQQPKLIDEIVFLLSNGYHFLSATWYIGGGCYIQGPSVEMKRWLQSNRSLGDRAPG